jgi:glutathione S-transferase
MTDLPVLYSFRRCPYAMRARMALAVSGTVCVLREVELKSKPPELIAASPKATVPVMVLPDGTVIEESLDIMTWALRRNDPEAWLAGADMALIAANDGPFKFHLDRTKYPGRYDKLDPAHHRTEAFQLLLTLEDRLAESAFLCGAQRSLADMAIAPFVRQFAAIDPGWFAGRPLPRLQAWLSTFVASPLFAQVMTKQAPWRAGQSEVLFPAQAA